MSELVACRHCAELLFTGASTCPHCARHLSEGTAAHPLPMLMLQLLASHGGPVEALPQVPDSPTVDYPPPEPTYGIPATKMPPPREIIPPDKPLYGVPDIAPDWSDQ